MTEGSCLKRSYRSDLRDRYRDDPITFRSGRRTSFFGVGVSSVDETRGDVSTDLEGKNILKNRPRVDTLGPVQ